MPFNTSEFSSIYLVRQVHNIPHLNSQFHEENSDFALRYNHIWGSYGLSLLGIPFVLTAAITATIFIIAICIWFRPWIMYRNNSDKSFHIPVDNNTSNIRLPLLRWYSWFLTINSLSILSCMLVALGIIANNVMIYGNFNFYIHGLDVLHSNLNEVLTFAQSLISLGADLNSQASIIQTLILESIPSCPQAESLVTYSDNFQQSVATFSNYVGPVASSIENTYSRVSSIKPLSNVILWITYTLIYLMLFGSLFGVYNQNKPSIRRSIGTNLTVTLILFFFGSLLMAVLIGWADFCENPFVNVTVLFPVGATRDVTSYYSTCEGENPLYLQLQEASMSLSAIQSSIAELLNSCSNNRFLIGTENESFVAQSTLRGLNSLLSCSNIQPSIYKTLSDGFCNYSFSGVYFFWLWIYVSCGCTLFVSIVMSVIDVYFASHWSNSDDISLFEDGIDLEYSGYDKGDELGSVLNPARRRSSSHISDISLTDRRSPTPVPTPTHNSSNAITQIPFGSFYLTPSSSLKGVDV